MRVIFQRSVLTEIVTAIYAAKREDQKIHAVIIDKDEMRLLCSEMHQHGNSHSANELRTSGMTLLDGVSVVVE